MIWVSTAAGALTHCGENTGGLDGIGVSDQASSIDRVGSGESRFFTSDSRYCCGRRKLQLAGVWLLATTWCQANAKRR